MLDSGLTGVCWMSGPNGSAVPSGVGSNPAGAARKWKAMDLSETEIALLRVAVRIGAFVQTPDGPYPEEIAHLEALGFLKHNPEASSPDLGMRRLEITTEGLKALAEAEQDPPATR